MPAVAVEDRYPPKRENYLQLEHPVCQLKQCRTDKAVVGRQGLGCRSWRRAAG